MTIGRERSSGAGTHRYDRAVRGLRPGLWHWTAPHPQWDGDQEVSSYAIDDGDRLLLFDPLAVPGEILALAAAREPGIVLTWPWHERDTHGLVERFGWPVCSPPPDRPADLARKYGVTEEEAAGGSPDLAWLGSFQRFGAGDRPAAGVEAFAGWEHNDVVLWIERHRALVVGDSLVDFGEGLDVWPHEDMRMPRAQVFERLRPLLELPAEVVLATHGGPADRTALERAFA